MSNTFPLMPNLSDVLMETPAGRYALCVASPRTLPSLYSLPDMERSLHGWLPASEYESVDPQLPSEGVNLSIVVLVLNRLSMLILPSRIF